MFVIANNDGDIAHGLNIERLNYIWARLDISFINAYGDLLESILDTRDLAFEYSKSTKRLVVSLAVINHISLREHS